MFLSLHHTNTSGHTLLSFCITVATVGVLAALSFPSPQELQDSNQLAIASRATRRVLENALTLSLQRGRTYRIRCARHSLEVEEVTTPIRRIAVTRLPLRVSLICPARVAFYPGGVTTPGTLMLSGREQQCALTLSLRGRVRTLCSTIG